MSDISDVDLMQLIVAADDQAFKMGAAPKQRWASVISIVMNRLGYKGYVLVGNDTPTIVKRINQLHSSLYRPSDIALGGLHGGVFMFRDVFARISIPIIYGRARIDFFQLTDLSARQLEWLSSRIDDKNMFIDQCSDIFDFAGGVYNLNNFKQPPDEALNIFFNAAFHFQAAAATLCAAFDYRGAVQSSLIAAELSLKGGLAAVGYGEKERRKHSHNLLSVVEKLSEHYPKFELERVTRIVKSLPEYVKNRYASEQPSRTEAGHIAMKAQYVAAEVMRQITGYTVRNAFNEKIERFYP